MLTIKDINILKNCYATELNSYEDFSLSHYFENKSSKIRKYDARFDKYFSGLDNQYNNNTASSYIVDQYMMNLEKINNYDFNDMNSINDFVSQTYWLQQLMQNFNNLCAGSICDDLSANFEGWQKIAKLNEKDISIQLTQFQQLIANIISDDVFTPIISKIEKLLDNMRDIKNDIKYFDGKDNSSYMESCFNLKRNLSFFKKYSKQDNILDNLIAESKIFDHIESYKKIRLSIVETLQQDNYQFSYSDSDSFVRSINNSNNVKTILLEQTESRVIDEIKFNQEYYGINNLYLFKDSSIAFKNKRNEWKSVESMEERHFLIESLLCREMAYKLKKNPTIAKLFMKKLKENPLDCQKAFTTADTYIANEAILKSKDYNLLEEIRDHMFEDLDDSMNSFIRKHNIEHYGFSIASKKYKELYNEKSFQIIGMLYDLKVPSTELQESLGRKLASFKNTNDFNKALRSLYMIHSSFNNESVAAKARINNAEIIKNKDNILIIKIDNFLQSAAIGSSAWCISRNEVYFKSYTKEAQQYFVYDFNKDPTDNDSIVGVTLRSDGSHSAAHFKNDDVLNNNDVFKSYQLDILRHDLKSYKNLDKELKIQIDNSTKIIKKSLFQELKSKFLNL